MISTIHFLVLLHLGAFVFVLVVVDLWLCFIQFLRCREAWLTGILDDLDQRNPYEYLKGMVNCHRMHLFDVVNQYRAIFADDTSGSEENYDGGLLFSWAMHQITSHLRMLKVMLPKITEGGSLSNILDQCMVSDSFGLGFIMQWQDRKLACTFPLLLTANYYFKVMKVFLISYHKPLCDYTCAFILQNDANKMSVF